MTTLPLLAEGTPQTKERVLRNFDWLYRNGISPSGYYNGTLYRWKYSGDFLNKPLGMNAFLNWPKVEVPAGKTVVIEIKH